jgi:adenylosuccinate synthase
MKKARVIIGAAFGDEGKGLMTDYFAHSQTTICRYNGGAQAGHTVQLKDGRRHVFHHFGSGCFRGATTYLSRFFISNPIIFNEELSTLRNIGIEPIISADQTGLVTTPYDMMLNTMIEQKRGDARHGSCGFGINETLKRSDWSEFKLTIWELHDRDRSKQKLRQIRDQWIPKRAAVLGLIIDGDWQKTIADEGIFDHFLDDAFKFYRTLSVLSSSLYYKHDILFEGAQGLCLDQDHAFFPYVTPSSTGLKNVIPLAQEARVTSLEAIYVTRAYATRHGAGPFPREVKDLHYDDYTNQPNDWQGTLRFGHLDLDLISQAIHNDLKEVSGIHVHPMLAITCLNQVGDLVTYWHQGRRHTVPTADLWFHVRNALDIHIGFLAIGPRAEDVRRID